MAGGWEGVLSTVGAWLRPQPQGAMDGPAGLHPGHSLSVMPLGPTGENSRCLHGNARVPQLTPGTHVTATLLPFFLTDVDETCAMDVRGVTPGVAPHSRARAWTYGSGICTCFPLWPGPLGTWVSQPLTLPLCQPLHIPDGHRALQLGLVAPETPQHRQRPLPLLVSLPVSHL